ncbi:MAG TPA: hypothetical protein VKA12_12895 [Roseiarcus sp.]|nr:hypothetical protein [Roseiarcus sp.]
MTLLTSQFKVSSVGPVELTVNVVLSTCTPFLKPVTVTSNPLFQAPVRSKLTSSNGVFLRKETFAPYAL